MNYEDEFQNEIEAMEKYSLLHAEREALARNLDEMTKVILAEEMLQYEGPQWKAEALARISDRYKLHLEGLKEARHQANESWARYECAKAKFERTRSLLSYHKKQLETFPE